MFYLEFLKADQEKGRVAGGCDRLCIAALHVKDVIGSVIKLKGVAGRQAGLPSHSKISSDKNACAWLERKRNMT
jgi:hypothetical protein